jgi:hypothetical protein
VGGVDGHPGLLFCADVIRRFGRRVANRAMGRVDSGDSVIFADMEFDVSVIVYYGVFAVVSGV